MDETRSLTEQIQKIDDADQDGWRKLLSQLPPNVSWSSSMSPAEHFDDFAAACRLLLRRCAEGIEPMGSMHTGIVEALLLLLEQLYKILRPGIKGSASRAEVVKELFRSRAADLIFVKSFVPDSKAFSRLHGFPGWSRNRLAIHQHTTAWSMGLLERYICYLKAEDNVGFAGGAYAVAWAVEQLYQPLIDRVLGDVLALLVPMCQDPNEERRFGGLKALRHVIDNVGREALEWHWEAIHETLKVALSYRQVAPVTGASKCVCNLIRILEGSKFRTSIRTGRLTQLHELVLRAILYMAESRELEDRRAAASIVGEFLQLTGARILLHMRSFLPSMLFLLESMTSAVVYEHENRFAFYDVVQAVCSLVRIVWPRVPSHYDSILPTVFACIFRVEEARSRAEDMVDVTAFEGYREGLVEILVLAGNCGAPEAFEKALLDTVRRIPQLTAALNMVYGQISDNQFKPPGGCPFGEFERDIFAAEGDWQPNPPPDFQSEQA